MIFAFYSLMKHDTNTVSWTKKDKPYTTHSGKDGSGTRKFSYGVIDITPKNWHCTRRSAMVLSREVPVHAGCSCRVANLEKSKLR